MAAEVFYCCVCGAGAKFIDESEHKGYCKTHWEKKKKEDAL